MNVLNMHIGLDQEVDKVHSQRADQLLPEEKDLALNKAMWKFINQRYGRNNVYGKGFEESQKRIDDLRTLVTEHEDGVFFKEELKPGKIWVDSFRLPSNYMYLVNQRGKIYIDGCKYFPRHLESQQQNIFYFTFSFNDLMVDGSSFVESLRMQNDEFGATPTIQAPVWIPSPNLIASGYTSASYPQNIQEVINDLLQNPQSGFQIFYESYGELNFQGRFIVVVDVNAHPWFTWDGSLGTVTPLVSVGLGNVQISSSQPSVESEQAVEVRKPLVPVGTDQVINRFAQQDDIFRMLDDPFNTTNPKEPLTTIRQDFIDLYTSDIFIMESVKITYIRKPLPISLSLGYDCELPDHTHQEIIGMAASSILEELSDPRYKSHQVEAIRE